MLRKLRCFFQSRLNLYHLFEFKCNPNCKVKLHIPLRSIPIFSNWRYKKSILVLTIGCYIVIHTFCMEFKALKLRKRYLFSSGGKLRENLCVYLTHVFSEYQAENERHRRGELFSSSLCWGQEQRLEYPPIQNYKGFRLLVMIMVLKVPVFFVLKLNFQNFKQKL